jgi:hypothetical protein
MAEPDPPNSKVRSFIPMSPQELPQQRIAIVVDLPPRPAGLVTKVDWIETMEIERPKRTPKTVELLCAAEWAWGPYNGRLDNYYLSRRRSEWLIWNHIYDDNWGVWNWKIYAYSNKLKGSPDPFAVGVWMLVDAWRKEASGEAGINLDCFDWLTLTGMLEVPVLRAMAREVWDKNFREADNDDQE